MATAYLICGSTGAGKTTYSSLLAVQKSAQIFSIDEWMQALFWKDAPQNPEVSWALERVERCERQIWAVAKRLLDAEINVILDLGFSRREQRERLYGWVKASGNPYQLHFLDVSVEVRRLRVRNRNEQRNGTFQFEVSDSTFDWMETYFERPSEEELKHGIVVTN